MGAAGQAVYRVAWSVDRWRSWSEGAVVCVFRAEGPLDAWLVRDHLVASGIDAVVRDDLALARGEVPVDVSWPTVWVASGRAADASLLLASWKAPYPIHPEQLCRACGAASPPTFDWCWSCEAPFSG